MKTAEFVTPLYMQMPGWYLNLCFWELNYSKPVQYEIFSSEQNGDAVAVCARCECCSWSYSDTLMYRID